MNKPTKPRMPVKLQRSWREQYIKPEDISNHVISLNKEWLEDGWVFDYYTIQSCHCYDCGGTSELVAMFYKDTPNPKYQQQLESYELKMLKYKEKLEEYQSKQVELKNKEIETEKALYEKLKAKYGNIGKDV